MARWRLVSVFGATSVLATVVIGTQPVAAVAPSTAGPGHWVQLSAGAGLDNIDSASLHRFGTSLQVVWSRTKDASLHTRILAASGAPASPDQTLLTWTSMNQSTAVIPYAGQRLIVFSGLQNTNSGNPFAGGFGYYLTSPDGKSWTLAQGTFGSDPAVYDTAGLDATDAGGTPVVVYPAIAASDVSYHAGLGALPPAAGLDPTTLFQPGTCCAYLAGVGYDTKSGQTWTAWYQNSEKTGTEGINAQRIYPATGTQLHAPSSSSTFAGQASAVAPEERVAVAARVGGGLYTAYGVGYPSQSKVALWKLGTSKPVLTATDSAIAFPSVAAAPGGRLWLFWWVRNTATLYAARTNTAGTRLGATCLVPTPHGTTTVWNTAGDATKGKLDLVVNANTGAGAGEQLFSTQVLPCLSASVSSAAVTSAHGGKVTVTITDAGAAVHGAYVRYSGKTEHTNAHGQAMFTIAKATAKHTYAITYGDSGYTGGTLHFRVN